MIDYLNLLNSFAIDENFDYFQGLKKLFGLYISYLNLLFSVIHLGTFDLINISFDYNDIINNNLTLLLEDIRTYL